MKSILFLVAFLSATAHAEPSCNDPYVLIKGTVMKDSSMGLREGLPAFGTYQLVDEKSDKGLLGLIPPGFKRTAYEESIQMLDKLVGQKIYGCIDPDLGPAISGSANGPLHMVTLADFISEKDSL